MTITYSDHLQYQLDGFGFSADVAPPQQFSFHHHPEVEILLILNQASAQLRWEDDDGQSKCEHIKAEHLCVLPSHQPHAFQWDRSVQYINILVDPTLLFQKAQDCVVDPTIIMTGKYGIHDPLILSLALALQSAFQAEGVVEHLYIDMLINTLLMYLLKTCGGCKFRETTEKPIPYQPWLRDVLYFIHNSLDQDLRLARLAEISNMSESGFCHQFKKNMDISPHQYIIQERILLAKELLLKRKLPISEIAYCCGFNSQSHLTYYFRQHTGITPKVYQLSI